MKQVIYPINYVDGTCPNCGRKSIQYLNKYDKKSNPDIYPVDRMYCNRCNTEFLIRWIKDDNDNFIAAPTSANKISDFENEVAEYSIDNKRDIELKNYNEYNQLLKSVEERNKEKRKRIEELIKSYINEEDDEE